MQSFHGHSAACCSIPPIIAKGYKEKGKYETIGDLETCDHYPQNVTGPSSEKALLVMYDAFGFFSQTIQGADILATSDKEHQYQVFMPDFFEGVPCDIAWHPPLTEEQGKLLSDWFPPRMPHIGAVRIPKIISDIEAVYGKKTWGAVGFCWGAKVVSLTSGPDTLFKANCQAHPGMFDPADAEKISIPTLMLASAEESAEEVMAWKAALKVDHHVEIRGEQVHGWMSARGNLEDATCKAAYENGYKTFLEWFAKHL
ncbi:putative aim2 family [Hyphodiscus hymeniophilus]|uniref:Aim2 family n=1 Tax=Hyphodiscus hymeniophilus TaxID=353542 RepID=A0A9P6VKV0_9HELO|nr:putative aim2 family [Hyphodiscus hymeniophilus]